MPSSNLHLMLGLGHKRVMQKPPPNMNFTPAIDRLRRDIRIKHLFADEHLKEVNNVGKKHCIK